MLNQNTLSRLKSEIAGQVRLDEPMSAHTSFHIGGPADALVIPADLDDVRKILRIASIGSRMAILLFLTAVCPWHSAAVSSGKPDIQAWNSQLVSPAVSVAPSL